MDTPTDKKHILEQHKVNGDVIKIRLIYPETRPIFYKGKVKEVNEDNFIFIDIIDGETMLGFDCLQEIKVLEKGKNGDG